MITIIQQPKSLDFTGNGLGFKIHGDDYIEQQGIIASASFSVSFEYTLKNGEKFILKNFDSGDDLIITARYNPTQPNEISLVRADQIYRQLNNVEEFARFYRAYNSGEKLYIETLIGQNYDWSNLVYPSMTIGLVSTTEGRETIYREAYSLFGKLFYYDDANNLKEIAQFSLDPDSEMNAEIFIGNLLESYIKPQLPILESNTPNYIKSIKYMVQFFERYMVNGELLTFNAYSVENYALLGKIKYLDYPAFDITNYINISQHFLNFIDYPVNIFKEQKYFLYIFKPNLGTTINLKVRIFYTDRSTSEHTVYNFWVMNNNPVAFYCGPEQLDIDNLTGGKEWYKYQVYIDDFAGFQEFRLSEKPLYARQFLFLNRLGVFEPVLITGKRTEKLNIKRKDYRKPVKLNYTRQDSELAQVIEEKYKIFEIKSGSITKKEAENISYLFYSPYVYELIDNEYQRIFIEDNSIEINKEDETLFDLKFSYRYAHYE